MFTCPTSTSIPKPLNQMRSRFVDGYSILLVTCRTQWNLLLFRPRVLLLNTNKAMLTLNKTSGIVLYSNRECSLTKWRICDVWRNLFRLTCTRELIPISLINFSHIDISQTHTVTCQLFLNTILDIIDTNTRSHVVNLSPIYSHDWDFSARHSRVRPRI